MRRLQPVATATFAAAPLPTTAAAAYTATLPTAAPTATLPTAAQTATSRSAALATAYNATLPIAIAPADDLPQYLRHSWRCSLPGRGLGCLWVHV